ncbi:MAG: phage terminase large subunit family protein [Verrucomicrobia bacterium]|nr:phage terminase large subunit family protein [Verrucomicrobiota bacterium]
MITSRWAGRRWEAFRPERGERARVIYTWNALLPHWIEWRSIVEEFLAAVDAMRIEGDIEPMFTFVTETLGEPWDLDRWLVTGHDHLQERKADYDFGDPWPLEKTRFLAADRQARGGEHYFWGFFRESRGKSHWAGAGRSRRGRTPGGMPDDPAPAATLPRCTIMSCISRSWD